jgi:DNA-binding transcriptional LysR family regulator
MARARLKERQIEVFRAVMTTGSLTSASQQLGVSQPSLSMTIRRFEDEIGARLFERIGGRLVPTDEAKLILVEVERVYGQFDRLSEAIHSIATGDASVFRFGTTPSIGMRLVPKALKCLKERHAARTYYCDFLAQRDIRDYLLFGQGSCVTTIAEANDPTLETIVIAKGRLVCLAPRTHPLAQHASISPKMLRDETLISFASETPHGRYIDATYARAGVSRKTDIFVHFVEAAISFVCEDIGISVIDEFSAMDCDRMGLVAIPIEDSVEIQAYVHWCRFRPHAKAADELIEALVDVAGSRPRVDRP